MSRSVLPQQGVPVTTPMHPGFLLTCRRLLHSELARAGMQRGIDLSAFLTCHLQRPAFIAPTHGRHQAQPVDAKLALSISAVGLLAAVQPGAAGKTSYWIPGGTAGNSPGQPPCRPV